MTDAVSPVAPSRWCRAVNRGIFTVLYAVNRIADVAIETYIHRRMSGET